jgi:uncharacterized LabA/DUF88 family protein
MRSTESNYAFIDSQNLNLNIKLLGWSLDFAKFRIYLKEKYHVSKAFLFIGYAEENKRLYSFLEKAGYILVFKPIVRSKEGHMKGNCDAELVLQTMIEINNFEKALIVSGDGDFYCLIQYLLSKQKLTALLIPNQQRYSSLFKNVEIKAHLRFMNDLKEKLLYTKEKAP